MSYADSVKHLIGQLYVPVYKLAALIPASHLLLTIAGLGACVAGILGLQGASRWVALLVGLYLFGGAWLLLHAPSGSLEW